MQISFRCFWRLFFGKFVWIVSTLILLLLVAHYYKKSVDQPELPLIAPLPPLIALMTSRDTQCKLTLVFAPETGRMTTVPATDALCPSRSTLWIYSKNSSPIRFVEFNTTVATQITVPAAKRALFKHGAPLVAARRSSNSSNIGSIIASGKIQRVEQPPKQPIKMRSSSFNYPNADPIPTVVLTFDYYQSAYTLAYPIMNRYGLVGTWFLDPHVLNDSARGFPTSSQARELEAAGWEIGAYTRYQMVNLIRIFGPEIAAQHLAYVRDAMAEKGFLVRSLAPNSRRWNAQLRDISSGIFDYVRVASKLDGYEPQPLNDPLYIDSGGTLSLSKNDTSATLAARLDRLQESHGVWFVIVHKIDERKSDAFSIRADIFEEFCAEIDRRRKAGKLRVLTISELEVAMLHRGTNIQYNSRANRILRSGINDGQHESRVRQDQNTWLFTLLDSRAAKI